MGRGMSFAQQSALHMKDLCYGLTLLYVPCHPSSVFLLLLSPFSLRPNIAPNACPSYKDFAVSILFSKTKGKTGKSKCMGIDSCCSPNMSCNHQSVPNRGKAAQKKKSHIPLFHHISQFHPPPFYRTAVHTPHPTFPIPPYRL